MKYTLNTKMRHIVLWFAGLGLLSAVVSWVVLTLIGRSQDTNQTGGQWFFDYFPGFNFGLFLFIASALAGFIGVRRELAFAAIIAASVLSWPTAIQVAIRMDSPFTFAAAGAVGALIIAIPLIWVWRLSRQQWPVFVAVVVAAGVFSGSIHEITESSLPSGGDMGVFILMLHWQAIVFAASAYAMLRKTKHSKC